MKWIVITTPDFIENEAEYINQLFECGIDLLHLRKPDSDMADCELLIKDIDPKWYPQIVVHNHFPLCQKYHLHGIHLNRRNNKIPKGFKGSISCSCHSFEEVEIALNIKETKTKEGDKILDKSQTSASKYNYVFLSPIFDSISKQGYNHSFSNRDLEEAATKGIINDKVIALGGITFPYIPQLRAWNFGGAAFLGDVWNRRNQSNWTEYLAGIRKRIIPNSSQNSLQGSNVW